MNIGKTQKNITAAKSEHGNFVWPAAYMCMCVLNLHCVNLYTLAAQVYYLR